MRFFQSRKAILTYQLTVFLILLTIGFFTFPSQFANMMFLIAAMGVFYLVNTLMMNKKRSVRLGLIAIIAIVYFCLIIISIIKSFN